MFHRHQWKELSRHYTGRSGVSEVDRASSEAIERLVFGITTIVQRCRQCGALSTTEIKGDARVTLTC